MSVHDDTLTGLQEALIFVKGDKTKAKSKKISLINIKPIKNYDSDEIRNLRNENNMTQRIFANLLGVTIKTVEAWEAGTNKANGSALRIFQLLEENKSGIIESVLAKD